MISIILAWISGLVWGGLLLFRGMFWRVDSPELCDEPDVWPKVVAVIPARNEAETIGDTVKSLLLQDYPGDFHIVITDDASEDDTAGIAMEAAQSASGAGRLTVIKAPPLPDGWQGKMWAQQQGLDEVAKNHGGAGLLLLTDADIVHAPSELRRTVARMLAKNLDMASLMVRLSTESKFEKAIIPAFVFFFRLLYPFRWVAKARKKIAAAAGGYILVKKDVIEQIGGFGFLRDALIDDCVLAFHAKRLGAKLTLDLADETRSSRCYNHPEDVWMVIARSAFTKLGHSGWILAGTTMAMIICMILPPWLFIFFPHARAMAFTAWVEMALAYAPIIAWFRLPFYWSYLLPFVAIFYLGATIDSARRHWMGRGGMWKGRKQVVISQVNPEPPAS